MNSTIGMWDYLLSPAALGRSLRSDAEIKWGHLSKKKLHPLHDKIVKAPKIADVNDVYLIISQDSNGLK